MTVAVYSNGFATLLLTDAVKTMEQVPGQGLVGRLQRDRNKVIGQQVLGAVNAVTLQIDGRAVGKTAGGTQLVNATQRATKDQQIIEIIQFGRVPALARKQGKEKPVKLVQRLPRRGSNGSNNPQIQVVQVERELMLFKDLLP